MTVIFSFFFLNCDGAVEDGRVRHEAVEVREVHRRCRCGEIEPLCERAANKLARRQGAVAFESENGVGLARREPLNARGDREVYRLCVDLVFLAPVWLSPAGHLQRHAECLFRCVLNTCECNAVVHCAWKAVGVGL